MLRFPLFHEVDSQQKVRVGSGFGTAVDDAGVGDEVFHRNRVYRVVGVILAADPMHRCVEVGAGVL
ncbi:hypothetical protein SDC9_183673 [bioreactor metagenome]|uniref:Uncharacterized protein n=1 Tax=bioreactor metagenome TaxID=1076179 RepID=A0A645HCB6_9ZZZZ